MPPERIASLLLLLAPLWPVLAAVVMCIPRQTGSDEEAVRFDRECRVVAALSAALSCGSLLAALLISFSEVRAPDVSARSTWLVIPAADDIYVTFQLRMDSLSGPAAVIASLLGCVAFVSQRRITNAAHPAPYRIWLLLLSTVQVLLLANDLVLLVAAIVLSELLCRSLVPRPLSWMRSLTLFPLLWILAQWLIGFTQYNVDALASPNAWRAIGEVQPIFTLVSGLCLLTFVMGRMGHYPFCVDVDRVYDETPGRVFWFGLLGSWIPAQYVLLRFWPTLEASTLGVPSLTSLAVLLTILAAWMALARPHRAGSLAMIGAGMLALTWTALGSGLPIGPRVAEAASLSLLLMFGSLAILADAGGWLSDSFADRRVPGRRTLWVTLILLASGVGMQQAWDVTFVSSRQITTVEVVDDAGEELIEVPAPKVPASAPLLLVVAHGLLWLAAGRVLSPILLGQMAKRAAAEGLTDASEIVFPTIRDANSAVPTPVLRHTGSSTSSSASWLSRRLCGGLVLSSLLWGPAMAELFQRRGLPETARLITYLSAAPWGVMLPAGLLGLVVGCWIGFAAAHRALKGESWQKLADAGRRLFYLPEIGLSLMAPFRQLLELPRLVESLWIPTAEVLPDDVDPPAAAEREPSADAPPSAAVAWLLPLAGLTSVAVIWTLLLMW